MVRSDSYLGYAPRLRSSVALLLDVFCTAGLTCFVLYVCACVSPVNVLCFLFSRVPGAPAWTYRKTGAAGEEPYGPEYVSSV